MAQTLASSAQTIKYSPSPTRNLATDNLATYNVHTTNMARNNLATNNYLAYKWKVDRNRITNKYGSSAPEISPLQAQMNKRMEYSFDYNKPNEVNSYADVIMRTLTNVGRTMRGMKTINDTFIDFGTDTYNLFYRGSWQPLVNKDWGVLLANNFVNFRETVDLVDNVWKGFAIGGQLSLMNGGNFDWEGAKEGMRRATVERQNYDFDTGNKKLDLVLEMATPTNIALLLLSAGAGNVAKAAAKEAGETGIKTGLVKSFGKNYTSKGLDATFKAMGKNLTSAEIASLTNISKHVKNLELLSGFNKMKKAIDIVDKAGPSIAWKGTLGIPWGVIKATTGASKHAIRYFATAVESVQAGNPNPGLISVLAKRPEYEILFDNLATAMEIVEEKQITVVFDDLISGASNLDNNVLKNKYNDFYKTFNSKKLVEQYVDDIFSKTGEFKAFELAQKEFQDRTLKLLMEELNMFAYEASGKMYKTFDEYANVVNILHEASGKAMPGLQALHKTVTNIEKQMHALFVQDVVTEVSDVIVGASKVLEQVTDTKRIMEASNSMELNSLVQKLNNTIDAKDSIGIVSVAEKQTKYKGKLYEIFESLKKFNGLEEPDVFAKKMNAEIETLEDLRSKGYQAFQKAKKASGDKTPFDSSLLDSKIAEISNSISHNKAMHDIKNKLIEEQSMYRTLFQNTYDQAKQWNVLNNEVLNLEKQIQNFKVDHIPFGNIAYSTTKIDPIDAIERLIAYSDHIEKTVVLDKTLSNVKIDMYGHVQDFIEYAIDEVIRGTGRANLDLRSGKINSIAQYGREVVNSYTDIFAKLEELPVNLLKDDSFGAGLKELTQRMYGKNVLSFADETMEKLEKHFGATVKDTFEEHFKKMFYDGGVIKEDAYLNFLDDLKETVEHISEHPIGNLGDTDPLLQTMAGVSYEFAESLDRMQIKLVELLQDYNASPTGVPKINSKTIQDVLEEASTIKYNYTKALNRLEIELAKTEWAFKKSIASEILNVKNSIVDIVEKLEQFVGFTADIELAWSKDILTEYTMKFNTTLKNMHLLQNEELLDLLEGVAAKDYQRIPILESLEGMSRYDTTNLRELQNAIANQDTVEFNQLYVKMFERAFDESIDSIPELQEVINTIFEVQKSAQIMMDTLHGMVSVTEFYDSVNKAVTVGLDQDVAHSFIDAIQRTYDHPASLIKLGEINDNPKLLELEYNKIFNNMDMQLRNKSSKYNFKLENWYDWMVRSGEVSEEDLKFYDTMFGTKASMHHTAPADAYAEAMVHKYLIQDNEPGVKYFYVDIEGNGLGTATTSIYQKSVIDPETNVFKWYINTGVDDINLPQEDEVYHLLFGDNKNHIIPLDDLKNKFKQIYQNENTEEAERILREHFGLENSPIEIIMVKSEADLLRMSNEFIQSQKPPRGKIKYRMHNGLSYDLPLMNNRARYLGVENFNIGRHKVEDTFMVLEDVMGVRKLTDRERGTLESLIYDHIVRRNAELSSFGAERQLGTRSVKLNENLSKFLPTMDQQYMDAHKRIMDIFERPTKATATAEDIVGINDLFKSLTDSTSSFYEDLKNIDRMNKRLKQFRITINANDITEGNRLLPLDYAKNIPQELLANHVGMDLAALNMRDGVYIPIIGVTKHAAPNIVYEYFDTGGRLVTDRNMQQMTQMAGNIQKTMSYIRNPHLIDSMNVDSLHKLHDILLDSVRKLSGESYFETIIGDLKKGGTPLRSFATTNELFKMYNRAAHGSIGFVPDINGIPRFPLIKDLLEDPEFSDIVLNMINTKELFKNSLSQFGADKLYFTLEPKPGDAKAIYDYWGNMVRKSIKSLEELEQAQDLLQFTRLKRVASVYRGMQNSFDSFHNVAGNTVTHVNKLMSEGVIKNMPANLESATYNTLRTMSEAYDAIISFHKLQQVLESSSEDLASYLRHQGKGHVVFQNSSLFSDNYFVQRGTAKIKNLIGYDLTGAFEQFVSRKNALEELGIGIKITNQETLVYIKDMSKIADIQYKPMLGDFNMSEWIQIITDAGLADAGEIGGYMRDADYQGILKALNEVNESRANLIKLMPDGSTSTLEVLDEIAMGKVLDNIRGIAPDGIDLATMNKYGMFEGNHFNHSILGPIDARRVYMDYASFNPAKTMYNATSMVEKHLGAQVQLLELVQTPEFKLENFVSKVAGDGLMPAEDVITYLKQSHLKVAFLNDKSTPEMPNFKLAAVTINNKKDLDFALKMGATVLDTQTYNEAYKIINNYKIRNSVANFFDKVFVAPFKLGWMAWNYGVVARNYVDTIGKNITTTKDMAIIPIMAQMHADYGNYKNVLIDIYKYAEKQNIHVDVAIDEFFTKNAGNLKITRDAFNTIAEYKLAGGGVSMPKEIMEHYGDSIDRMFRNVKEEESGLSKTDFREMMKMPDDVARQWLTEKFPTDLARVEMLMDSKGDLLTYKRAYAMHKAYKGSGLSVNDLVTYLKSGRLDPEYTDIVQDLMEKTKGITLQESVFTKAMNHPFIANSLDWNMASEEILRLSMFKYMRDTGYNTVETMAEIARTHFDYGKKHWAQMYMEMAMPFSTFKIMSLMYWVEEMSNNAGSIEVLADVWSSLANLPDRQPEDAMLRRNLRYQMYTGNLVLNEETGLTAKINPTPIDMMNFFMSPVEYIGGMFHSGGQAVVDLLRATPYENESELSFYKRKQTLALNLVPLLGSNINKVRKAYEDARPRDEKNKKMELEPASMGQFILNLALSPLFNTTWTPEQSSPWRRYEPYKKRPYMPSISYYNSNYRNYKKFSRYPRRSGYARKHYPKKYYDKKTYPKYGRTFQHGYKDWSRYSTYNKTMNMPQFKFSRGSAYPTKASRSLNYAFSSVWRLSMTKKGNAKYKFMGFPTNKWTLKIKIQMLRNITSYNRWA